MEKNKPQPFREPRYGHSLGRIGLSNQNYRLLKRWKMNLTGKPAPTLRERPAEVWFGRRFSKYHEAPVLAAILTGNTPNQKATLWYFGVLRQKILEDHDDPLVAIVEAAEYPAQGRTSIERVSLAIDTLRNFIPPKHY